MGRCSHLHLSWLGWIHSVKMTLLPRILYLFLSLLIPISKDHLRRFQAKIVSFVWGSKGHHCAKEVLYRAYNRGGLGLPNLLWYYQAAQLAQISMIYTCVAKPDWVHMEGQAVPHFTLDYLMWCPPKARPPITAPKLSHSYFLWEGLKGHTELISQTRPLALLFHSRNEY